MASAFTVKTVRDPIYGCVYLTPAEQLIVDRPEFQRLRFVLQQSTAYLTYPSNATTRFTHSLGACHLAGQMFLSSLSNCDSATLLAFIGDAEKIIKTAFGAARAPATSSRLVTSCTELIGNPFVLHSTPPFTSLPSKLDELLHAESRGEQEKLPPLVVITILWQAIRFATLVHDLGHLPMSHLFEHAIEEFENSVPRTEGNAGMHDGVLTGPLVQDFQKLLDQLRLVPPSLLHENLAIHERLGCALFANIYPAIERGANNNNDLLAAIAWLAKCIVLIAPSSAEIPTPEGLQEWRVVRFLHLLIASELDADRLDYCARDPLASTMEFGAVNQTKIIRATRLVPAKNVNGGIEFVQGIDRRALVDVEFFFIQRFYALRTIVYHHNVQRSEAIMRHLLRDLMRICFEDQTPRELVKICREYGFWTTSSSGSSESGRLGPLTPRSELVGRFDDSWLRAFLYSIWTAARKIRGGREHDLDRIEDRIELFSDVILNRSIDFCLTVNKVDVDSIDLFLRAEDWAINLYSGSGESGVEDRIVSAIDGMFCFPVLRKAIESNVGKAIRDNYQRLSAIHVIADYEAIRFPKVNEMGSRLYIPSDDREPISMRSASQVMRALSTVVNVAEASDGKRTSDVLAGDFGLPRMRVFVVGPGASELRQKLRESGQSPFRDVVAKGLAQVVIDVLKPK